MTTAPHILSHRAPDSVSHRAVLRPETRPIQAAIGERLPLPGESLGQAALRRARAATALHLSQAAGLVHQVELARMRAEAQQMPRHDHAQQQEAGR